MARIRRSGLSMDAFYPVILALAVMLQGDHERAKGLVAEGLVLGRTSGNRLHTIQGIETAAMLATLEADPETAAKLWGAAEAEREALGAPPDPDDQALFEPYVAAASTTLGDEAWSVAWEEGRKTTLDQCVERVLAEGEAVPTAPLDPEQKAKPSTVLTRREREVAALLAKGLTNRRIAGDLFVSERTVDHHVANILKKLGLRSRRQVASRLNAG